MTQVDFNHISKDLSEEEVGKLKALYNTYRSSCSLHRKKLKRISRVRLLLNMLAMYLTRIGVIAGSVTMNPIIIGCISGVGIMMQGYIAKSDLGTRIGKCKSVYTSYGKVVALLRSLLRGAPYEEQALLAELRLLDEIIASSSDHPPPSCSQP